MRRLFLLCCLAGLSISPAEAGLSKINSVKVIVIASIASPAYIRIKDIKDQVTKDLKGSPAKISVKDGADIVCEVRYSDDYKLSLQNEMYGSYYLAIVIKSPHKDFDNLGPSSKVYWERGFFMPLIACKSLNASVKTNIGAFVSAFANEWIADQIAGNK